MRIDWFESDMINMTRGMGVLESLFHAYEDRGELQARKTGSLISTETGESTAYALDQIQQRGKLLIGPGEKVYAGMVVGENARDQDLPVNPTRTKKLTNMRSSGDGKGIMLEPPMLLGLERPSNSSVMMVLKPLPNISGYERKFSANMHETANNPGK